MDPNGPERSSKKKPTRLRRFESSAACQKKISRSSRSIAATLVVERVAVAVAAAPLIVNADTYAVFHFRRVLYLPVGFILMTLFDFVVCYREFSRFVVMLHSIANSQIVILNVATHNNIATVDDINVC